ncbi:MAG TPA: hypothetical protein PKI81_11520 [bacterium]|nr:hypothetical protein [bacterium]
MDKGIKEETGGQEKSSPIAVNYDNRAPVEGIKELTIINSILKITEKYDSSLPGKRTIPRRTF